MFFKGFKKKSAQKYISKCLKIKNTPSVGKITNLAILVDVAVYDEFPFISEISNVFNIEKESIDILYYTLDKNLVKQYPEKMFTDNNLGFGGMIKNDVVLSFIEKPYDGLLCYYNENKLMLNLVAVQSKAKFKIGFSGINELINNLSIATDLENIKEFTFELKKYLSILNKI